jgi:hypothetical protein
MKLAILTVSMLIGAASLVSVAAQAQTVQLPPAGIAPRGALPAKTYGESRPAKMEVTADSQSLQLPPAGIAPRGALPARTYGESRGVTFEGSEGAR